MNTGDRYLTAWHWQTAPEAVARVTQFAKYNDPVPVRAFDPGPRGLGYWVPRAMNVRETILNQLTATVLSKEYRCQEKLN